MAFRDIQDHDTQGLNVADILGSDTSLKVRDIRTHAPGPSGSVPFTADILINEPSGHHFGMSQAVAIGDCDKMRQEIGDWGLGTGPTDGKAIPRIKRRGWGGGQGRGK